MKKGMFYLLPLLALTQVATSNPRPQVEKDTVLVSTETTRVREAPAAIATVTAPTASAPRVVVRPAIGRPPRNGRNNRLSNSGRILIRRN